MTLRAAYDFLVTHAVESVSLRGDKSALPFRESDVTYENLDGKNIILLLHIIILTFDSTLGFTCRQTAHMSSMNIYLS